MIRNAYRVARGLQHHSLQHIDTALKATKRAVYDIEHHR